MLSEMEKDYEGYSGAVKTVMRESVRGLLKGVHGPIANLVHADDRFSLALETALGPPCRASWWTLRSRERLPSNAQASKCRKGDVFTDCNNQGKRTQASARG